MVTTVITAMLCAPVRGLADGQDQVSRLWAALGLLQWLGPRVSAHSIAVITVVIAGPAAVACDSDGSLARL